MKFNPSSYNPKAQPDFDRPEPLPAGDYVLAMMRAEVKQNKNGEDYLNARWEVCTGEFAGRNFFNAMGLDERDIVVRRWNFYFRALGEMGDVELDMHSGSAIERYCEMRPFKAEVSVKHSKRDGKEYVNNDIRRYHFDMTAGEQQAANAHLQRKKSKWAQGDDFAKPPVHADKDQFGDDNIPF